MNSNERPHSPAQARALEGLRILDLTRILAGPWATQILGDLGADVIKIERPGSGDDTRSWGPPNIQDTEGADRGAAYFHSSNRGKKSVALDITTPQGQDLLRRLILHCDVVIENFKVGGLAQYGLDYASLRQLKPDLIYCSITGFGHSGPYADLPGYDFLIQAMGGLMSLTGQPDGEAGGGPMKVGVALTDILTGLYANIGILAALRHRDRTGEGQHIDLALLDVQVATLANQALNYLATGHSPARMGNAHPNIVPYQAFAAADGYMIIAVGNDGQFARLCEVIGRSDLTGDPRYSHNPDRVRNRAELVAVLAKELVRRPRDAWLDALQAVGVPAGPINDLADVFSDPQVLARGMLTEPRTPEGNSVKGVGSPLNLSVTPVVRPLAAPDLGADSVPVLEELLGLSGAEIASLRDSGVIGGPKADKAALGRGKDQAQ